MSANNHVDEGGSRWWRKAIGILPIIFAILIVILMVKSKSTPEKKEIVETARPMRVITVPVVDLVPRAVGFGVSAPGQIWRAVSEVKGRVSKINPDLKAGALIKAGALLLKINPIEYELTIASLQANIDQVQADMAELKIQEKNTKTSLEIEKRSLLLAEKTLERKKKANKNRTVSADEVDREERNVLGQRQNVQNLQNSLVLYPSKGKTLQAKLDVNEANLKQAHLDLSKTVLVAPFHCRLGKVAIEQGQFLAAGQELFEAHSTAVTEIEAQFQGNTLRSLISGRRQAKIQGLPDMDNMRQVMDMKSIVRIRSGDWIAEWPARFDRIRETVDPDTRAFKVVVAVDKPYEKMILGERPPLSSGLFCEVELQGSKQPDSIVIPRSALHDNTVYIVNSDNRLQPISVTTGFAQSNFIIIDSGLTGGEKLVVSNPAPAITNMLIEPINDTDFEQRLHAEATGGGDLK
ncbi:MAG: efflux transporter periplasmic adaptor subunit [Candidatus Electrothrix sp. GM3_4]|nr:efflux transporter periplasmic adaptor subunit [Candidatus Electrothrix sp. GM3_4]